MKSAVRVDVGHEASVKSFSSSNQTMENGREPRRHPQITIFVTFHGDPDKERKFLV